MNALGFYLAPGACCVTCYSRTSLVRTRLIHTPDKTIKCLRSLGTMYVFKRFHCIRYRTIGEPKFRLYFLFRTKLFNANISTLLLSKIYCVKRKKIVTARTDICYCYVTHMSRGLLCGCHIVTEPNVSFIADAFEKIIILFPAKSI